MIIRGKNGKDNKIHLYVDDEYVTTVSREFWYSRNIGDGDEITHSELTALLDTVRFNSAYNRALTLLGIREHSRKELVDKLSRQVERALSDAVADRLEEINLLNDESYAVKLSAELKRRKGMSRYGILRELIHRGISREIAENTINDIDTDDKASIIEVFNKKFSKKNLSDEKEMKRAINTLLRLGYRYEDIKSVLNEISLNGED